MQYQQVVTFSYKDFVTSFNRLWNFTRSETLELLNSLTDEQLAFKPKGEKWQTLSYQFGCIGNTQLIYAKAIEEGKMDFNWFHDESIPKNNYKTKKELLDLLKKSNDSFIKAVRAKRLDEDFSIKWPGFNSSLPNHISTLIAHERLHHGQIISYFTLAGLELPKGFKTNWAL